MVKYTVYDIMDLHFFLLGATFYSTSLFDLISLSIWIWMSTPNKLWLLLYPHAARSYMTHEAKAHVTHVTRLCISFGAHLAHARHYVPLYIMHGSWDEVPMICIVELWIKLNMTLSLLWWMLSSSWLEWSRWARHVQVELMIELSRLKIKLMVKLSWTCWMRSLSSPIKKKESMVKLS
jgi:hypothetical protein